MSLHDVIKTVNPTQLIKLGQDIVDASGGLVAIKFSEVDASLQLKH